MIPKPFYFAVVALILTGCSKKTESDEVVKVEYNTPQATMLAASTSPQYYNTYYYDDYNYLRLNSGYRLTTVSKIKKGLIEEIYKTNDFTADKLTMVDDNTGYFTANSTLFKTIDGGYTWNSLNTDFGYVDHINFFGSSNLYINNYRAVYKSTNAGSSWQEVLILKAGEQISELYFYNTDLGFAGFKQGNLMRTDDAGKNWTKINTGTTNEIYSIFFADNKRGFFSTNENNFYLTEDGGKTWKKSGYNSIYNKAQFFFYPDGRGIIVSSNQWVYYTTDFGKTTEQILNIWDNDQTKIVSSVDDMLLLISDHTIFKLKFKK